MKGQLFSIDFMIALTIFIGTIAVISFLGIVKPGVTDLSMQAKANQISDLLVTGKLGRNENVLDCSVVVGLSSQSYDFIRNETKAAPFDIYVEFKNNTNICSGNQTSLGTPKSANTAVSVVRIVNLDNKMMQMIVRLYG